MTDRRQPSPAGRLVCLTLLAVALSGSAVPAQGAADELRMLLVSSDRIRALEENQRTVTGLLEAAYEEVEGADEALGKTRDLEPVFEAIASAGTRSFRLAMPSVETWEGLSTPLIGFCGEAPEAAWTKEAVRSGNSARFRLGQLVGQLEAFSLDEARETVRSALRDREGAEGIPPEANASLLRAEDRLLEASRIFLAGVAGPFARFLTEGAERLADADLVRELCEQRERESPSMRTTHENGREEALDPELAAATRSGALGTIRSTLATLDAFVLPRGSSVSEVVQGFTPPVRTNAVAPAYSNFARRACLAGDVRLELALDRDGVPQAIRVLSGSPVLARSAVGAARQWRFEPATLDGEPVDFDYRLTVTFELGLADTNRCQFR